MKTLIIPSVATTISSTPLELHYLDEYSLFVVFLTEIMYVFYYVAPTLTYKYSVINTTQPISSCVGNRCTKGFLLVRFMINCFILYIKLTVAHYRGSARVSISPDRRHLICNNLANGVDRYSISDSNWLTTHSINDISHHARAVSRLYGVAFLDCRVVVCGNNGSKIILVYDTNRPGP